MLHELLRMRHHLGVILLACPTQRPQLEEFSGDIIWTAISQYDFFHQRQVAKIINDSACDVYLSPTYFIPQGLLKPFIATVHDIIPRRVWLGKATLYLYFFLAGTLKRALAVWTVTQYSMRQITAVYPGVAGKIHVVPSGICEPRTESESPKEIYTLMLFASRFRHKNVLFGRQVFQQLQRLSGRRWHLHVIGSPQSTEAFATDENVTVHGRMDDAQLRQLYLKSWGLLIPSLEEGFSLPLLEGMNFDCLVFYHRHTAMSEVAGEGGIGLDIDHALVWAEAIQKYADDEELARSVRLRGRERAALYTSERFASAFQSSLRRSTERLMDGSLTRSQAA